MPEKKPQPSDVLMGKDPCIPVPCGAPGLIPEGGTECGRILGKYAPANRHCQRDEKAHEEHKYPKPHKLTSQTGVPAYCVRLLPRPGGDGYVPMSVAT